MQITSFDDIPILLSVKQLSKVMGVSLPTAYELTRQSGFPVIRIGEKRLVVPKDSLRQWLEDQAKNERST